MDIEKDISVGPELPATSGNLEVVLADRPASYMECIEQVEKRLLQFPQVQTPLTHRFAPHVYWREIEMPAGCIVIGHRHKTEHFNVVLTGRARVMMDGVVEEIVAPTVFVSKPGVRKVLYILETMRWATVHPTDETDQDRLVDELVIKSETYLQHHKTLGDLAQLKETLCLLQH